MGEFRKIVFKLWKTLQIVELVPPLQKGLATVIIMMGPQLTSGQPFEVLCYDENLPWTRALINILVCLGHLILRFRQYQSYPTKLCFLCRKHNNLWENAIVEFLTTPASELDVGYSARLFAEAWSKGSEAAAMDYLMSEEIQAELEAIFVAGQATSLDVERKHASDKRNEANKVITVGRASRNTILRQYRTERQRQQATGEHNKYNDCNNYKKRLAANHIIGSNHSTRTTKFN